MTAQIPEFRHGWNCRTGKVQILSLIPYHHLVSSSPSPNRPKMTSFLIIPPKYLKDTLPTQEIASNIIPQIITAVETCREWYHNEYPKADEQERKKREESLRKIMVSPLGKLHFNRIQNKLSDYLSTCHTCPSTDR